ncbi:hypothetical protein MBLNU230_g0711t2 [Neophaeotheca triangularis]
MLFSRQQEEASSDALQGFQYYHYDPSLPAAVIFVILFFLTTALQTYQFIRTRTWFLIPFWIGGLFETVGYIGRAISSQETPDWTLGPYIIQSILLLVAPALFAASVYMTLGRICLMVEGDHALLVRRKWTTKFFVAGDVISFLMQAAGGGLMSQAENADMGSNIVVAGLFVQIVFFGGFVITSTIFHVRLNRKPTNKSMTTPWKKHMLGMYIISILIFVRSIVRVVEFIQGFDGYIISREWYLYIFDALVMWIAMVVMNLIHPSEVAAHIRGSGIASKRGYKMEMVSLV